MEEKQKVPAVLIVFLFFIGYSFISTLLLFRHNKTFIGAFFFEGISSAIYISILLIVYALIFMWTLKRNPKGRILTLIYYPISVLVLIFDVIMYFLNKELIVEFLSKINNYDASALPISPETIVLSGLLFSLAFQIIISVLIIFLMIKKKDYFSPKQV